MSISITNADEFMKQFSTFIDFQPESVHEKASFQYLNAQNQSFCKIKYELYLLCACVLICLCFFFLVFVQTDDKNAPTLLEKPLFSIWLLYDQATAHTYTLKRIMETALRCNVSIRIVDVRDLLAYCDNAAPGGVVLQHCGAPLEQLPDVVLVRLGAMRCTPHSMRLLRVLAAKCVVLNHAPAIERAANKLETAFALAQAGVATPVTMPLVAASWRVCAKRLGFPLVVKTAIGSQGDGKTFVAVLIISSKIDCEFKKIIYKHK
jgi:hypothetical protein